MEIKLILFDMDGLMFDTERLMFTCWRDAFAQLGVELSEQAYRHCIGMNSSDGAKVLTEETGGDSELYDKARLLCGDLFVRHIEQHGTPHRPGLSAVMDELDRKGLPRAVATSTGGKKAAYILEKGGMLQRVSRVVSGDMAERGKPNPDIFLLAAKLMETPPQNCLVLEDSLAGVEAAWRAGMPVAMIPDMIEPDEAAKSRYTVRLSSLDDVISFLASL